MKRKSVQFQKRNFKVIAIKNKVREDNKNSVFGKIFSKSY